MSYMLLIFEPVEQREERTLEQGHDVYDQMLRFAESLKSRGVLRAVESLNSQAKGARVQVRNGKRMVVDGPFAEAKEMIGGFFHICCGKIGIIHAQWLQYSFFHIFFPAFAG